MPGRSNSTAHGMGAALSKLYEYAADMEPGQRRPNVTLSAPVGCVDLAAFDDKGDPYEIHACHYCLPWHAEVLVEDGNIFVREWHAVECESFQELLDDIKSSDPD